MAIAAPSTSRTSRPCPADRRRRARFRVAWALSLLTGLSLAALAATPVPVTDAAAAELWTGVELELRAGEPLRALELLAELTTVPEHKGAALERAAVVYLELGNDRQAVRLLQEAVRLPGHGNAANLLVRLLFKQKAYADIVAVHQLPLAVTWDSVASEILRVAYLAETGALPAAGLTEAGTDTALTSRLRAARVHVSADASVSQYPPYDEDRSVTDTEYGAGLTADVFWPKHRGLGLVARAAWREEWSGTDPQAFHAYRVHLFRLGAGAQYDPVPGLQLSGLAGLALGEPKHYSDIPHPELPPEWFAEARADWQWRRLTLHGSYYRDVFGAPDFTRYSLDSVQIPRLAAELRLAPAWTLEAAAETRQFTGDVEDYHVTGLRLRQQPPALTAFTFHYGWRHEFRYRDEDIFLAGTDWIKPLGNRHLLYASLALDANGSTRERELLAQVVLSRRQGQHTFQIGLAGRHEYNVYDRFSLTLFLQWQ